MSKCPEPIMKLREKYPELEQQIKNLALFDNEHAGILTEEEVRATLDRWVEAVMKENIQETYDEIDEELLMIKRGIKGKEIINQLKEDPKMKGKIGLLWDYLNCIETGKTMSANKAGRRRRRSTKKKKRKRRKRNSKKRTRRRRRKRRNRVR